MKSKGVQHNANFPEKLNSKKKGHQIGSLLEYL